MNKTTLEQTARALVAEGRGILAADESNGTMGKRLAGINRENTEENRRAWRELVLTTPGLGNHVSGIILFDETLRQSTSTGKKMTQLCAEQNIIPGIKVDEGLADFGAGEKVTKGIENLAARLPEYVALGARFAKWRALLHITDVIPTEECIKENARLLAEYAHTCQEAGLVPIVEPEILMDGPHTFERCREVTEKTYAAVFAALEAKGVWLPGILLKPSMVIAGSECPQQATPQQVAEATLEVLKATVPAEVPGIVFLSGGQSDEQATLHLSLMNQSGGAPWKLSFSYGRALQAAGLKAWGGEAANIPHAQKVLLHRARCNSAACVGEYTPEMEGELGAAA